MKSGDSVRAVSSLSTLQSSLCLTGFLWANVYRWIVVVVVLCVQIILHDAQRVAEPLEMHDLSCPQELERLTDVRVVDQAEQVVVGRSGLLFWYDGIRTTFEGDLYKLFRAAI